MAKPARSSTALPTSQAPTFLSHEILRSFLFTVRVALVARIAYGSGSIS